LEERQQPDPRLFRLMADRVTNYAIFLLDPAGRVISWNPGAERIKQYDEREILGKHFSLFYTDEDRARRWPEAELERALREGRFEDEGWRVRRDGSRFWANVVITALRDEDGQLLAFAKITRDMSERKRQEEALRESEERFRLLVDGVQDYAIYMLSPDGLVTSWNAGAARIKGWEAADVLGRHVSRFYLEEDIDAGKPWAELAVARETGRSEDEGWRVRRDGSRFWARVVVTTLYDESGRLRGFAKVTRDMTRERHAAALETSARQLNDFIAVLAHELRNPLAPIRNAAKLLTMVKPDEPDFGMMCRAIDRQSAQLARIVDDLLDIARITRGSLEIQHRPVDLGEVLARSLEATRPAISAASQVLTLDLPSGGPLIVEGDELRLTQALTNILGNATRYTEAGGRITVRLSSDEHDAMPQVAISVLDTGRGIEPDMLEAIFGMFVQGRQQRSGAGLGVGLALARSIVELHHGTVEARSEGPGRGAEFVMRLPLATSLGPIETLPEPARPAVPARRVLVVDDNADAADVLTALLQGLGHEVQTAHGGMEALEMAERFRPDVVLLDLGMPGMSGVEVARRLRERKRSPEPLIVAVTGWGKAEDRARSRAAGFDLHLVKPVEEHELREVLRRGSLH
jgi:PAS domain S-box-containing protein